MTHTLHAGHPEIKPHEIARTVLRDSGQAERDAVNPAQILELLHLHHLSVDFAREFTAGIRHRMSAAHPRAMLSAPDRLIATDAALPDTHTRFAVLHEIAHYLLPHHHHALYVCDDLGMSARTHLILEQEANALASDLLFQGDRFSVEANSRAPTAAGATALAMKYRASLEATARRIAQKSVDPCMMVLFGQGQAHGLGQAQGDGERLAQAPASGDWAGPPQRANPLDPDAPPTWSVRYCVPSPAFAMRHFSLIGGSPPPSLTARLTGSGRASARSAIDEIDLTPAAMAPTHRRFRIELFPSADDLIAFITPAAACRR